MKSLFTFKNDSDKNAIFKYPAQCVPCSLDLFEPELSLDEYFCFIVCNKILYVNILNNVSLYMTNLNL